MILPSPLHNLIFFPNRLDKELYTPLNLGAQLLGKLASYIIQPIPGIEYTEDMETPLQMLISKAGVY